MVILFDDDKLRALCCETCERQKLLGRSCARRLQRRLDDLRAAANLETMRSLPGRCHELTGDRARQLAMDLEHPKRLVFEAADEPMPLKEDGGLSWREVTVVRILEITDYH